MAQALAEVKRQLGDDAVILHTRTFQRRGLLGVRPRRIVEITASANISDLPRRLPAGKLQARRGTDAALPYETPRTAAPMVALPLDSPTIAAPPARTGSSGALSSRPGSWPPTPPVDGPAPDSAFTESISTLPYPNQAYRILLENEVAADIAAALVERIRAETSPGELGGESGDRDAIRDRLADYVASMLPAGGGIEVPDQGAQAVIALVGPTGVGKTTTVAKLAADLAMRQGRRVGLITLDTYRIAAVDQLRTYADIIGVPLQVASSADELRSALVRLADREVVLIDTAGRSPRDIDKLAALEQLLHAVPNCEVHLVLSAATGRRALDAAVEGFGILGAGRIIFTKLDEAVGCGVILGCLQKAQAALSYVTSGQNVPADIEIGVPHRLAEAILGAAPTNG